MPELSAVSIDGDEDDCEEEEDGSGTQDSQSLQAYYIFPLQSMLPTMFPYHEPTGASVCAHSHSVTSASHQSNVSNDTKRSVPSVDQTTFLKAPTTVEEVSLLLEDLHTRQLLDELQVREFQKEREEVAGTLEYNDRMDRLDRVMKGLIRQEEKMGRTTTGEWVEVARNIEKIGGLARTIGKTITARTAYKRVLQIRRRVHGEDSEAVAGTLQELGGLLNEIGEYKDAMRQYSEALGIRQHILGEKHILVGITLYSMGCTALHQGYDNQALGFLQEALDVQKLHLGTDSKVVGDVLETMGCLHVKRGTLGVGLSLLQNALRIRRRHGDLFQVASTLKHISGVYKEQQEHELAVGYFEEWLITLGDLYSGLGHAAETVKFYREALTIRTSIFGGYDNCNGVAILKAADSYFKNGETESAHTLYAKYIQAHNSQDDSSSSSNRNGYFYALLMLGNCWYSEGNLDEARRCLYNAVDVPHHDHDHDGDMGLLCNGRVQVQDILYKLLREVNNNKFGKLVERFKWMARVGGVKGRAGGGQPRKWQTWLSQKVGTAAQNVKK